jgi:hypothetical protein
MKFDSCGFGWSYLTGRYSTYCLAGWPLALIEIVTYQDDMMPVSAFGPRKVCTVCGAIGADVRANWTKRAPVSLYGPR